MTTVNLIIRGDVVRLLIPFNPIPLYRPRQAVNKKTGARFFYVPETCRTYQKLICVAALQRKAEILALQEKDSFGRLRIWVDLLFRSARHGDVNNICANISDGLGKALSLTSQTADKYFIIGPRKVDVVVPAKGTKSKEEGTALIDIMAYAEEPASVI